MPASALLAAASIASLNLCTDEYLLLLARPQEIASVSFLSQDPLESPLWKEAQRHPPNRGSLEEVLGRRPKLVLTMGGGGRATSLIARRLGIGAVDLRPVSALDDVAFNFRAVAAALDEPGRAKPWLARLARLRAAPSSTRDAIWLGGAARALPCRLSEPTGCAWPPFLSVLLPATASLSRACSCNRPQCCCRAGTVLAKSRGGQAG